MEIKCAGHLETAMEGSGGNFFRWGARNEVGLSEAFNLKNVAQKC